MSKINFNFHAKQEEILNFVKESMTAFDLMVVTVRLFPTFEREVITLAEFDSKMEIISSSKMLFLCKKALTDLSTDYMKFLEQNKENLVIQIGGQSDGVIKESTLGTITEDAEILKLWKKVLNIFKKEMSNGVWIVNPKNGANKFYKNHYYTQSAQKAYQNGYKMVSSVGWTEYHLTKELK